MNNEIRDIYNLILKFDAKNISEIKNDFLFEYKFDDFDVTFVTRELFWNDNKKIRSGYEKFSSIADEPFDYFIIK